MEKIQKNIKELKKRLPHGAQKEIAQRSGKTIFTVNRVFNGHSNNKVVLMAIWQYLKEINDVRNDIEEFIK